MKLYREPMRMSRQWKSVSACTGSGIRLGHNLFTIHSFSKKPFLVRLFHGIHKTEIYDFPSYDYESGKTEIFERAVAIIVTVKKRRKAALCTLQFPLRKAK